MKIIKKILLLAFASFVSSLAFADVSPECVALTPKSGAYTAGVGGAAIYGNNSKGYFFSSNVSKALIHSGLLAAGKTALIEITPLSGIAGFAGTNANGVQSLRYIPSEPECGFSLALSAQNPPPPPTISVQRDQALLVAGQSSSLIWSTTDAAALSRVCLSSGGGLSGSDALSLSGSATIVPASAWIGSPSTCTWSATGPGGTATYVENIATIAAVDNAEFVSLSVEPRMQKGSRYTATVAMKNIGSTTWLSGTFGLGTLNPVGNTTWGSSRIPVGTSVRPGESYTFSIPYAAPSTPGSYNFQWRMTKNAAGDQFGPASPNVEAKVDATDWRNGYACTAPQSGYFTARTSGGLIWGNAGTYRADSDIGVALVHSGLLLSGESAFVTIVPEDNSLFFKSTTHFGVTSAQFLEPACSMRLSVAEVTPRKEPSISITPSYGNIVAGEVYPLTWTSTDADNVTRVCTSTTGGPNGSNIFPPNGSIDLSPTTAWEGNFACTWTATGRGGTASVTDAHRVIVVTAAQRDSACLASLPGSGIYTASAQDGALWGNYINGYTADSSIPAALVQSGLAASGASVFVKVTSLGYTGAYGGMLANGVQSNDFLHQFCGMSIAVDGAASTPAPTATISASQTQSFAIPGQGVQVRISGEGVQQQGQVTKVELMRDDGHGFGAAAVLPATGSGPSLKLSADFLLFAGNYRFKLKATNTNGVVAESLPVTVTVLDAVVVGATSGVRISRAGKPELFGWACALGSDAPVQYSVLLDAPSVENGGTVLTTGMANLSGESDDSSVRTQCMTPGSSHNFVVDLSVYSPQYAGRALYVRGTAGTSSDGRTIGCVATGCTVPGGLRIALSLPTNGQHYVGASSIFAKALLSGGNGPYDEVAIGVDGTWTVANPDGAVDAYSLILASLPARVAPYAIQSRVRQGNTTLYSVANMIIVDASATANLTLNTPSANATLSTGVPQSLSATVVGGSVAAVRFFANGVQIATGSNNGGTWAASWTPAVANAYTIVARAYDVSGVQLAQSAGVNVTVRLVSGGAGSETPLPVMIDAPHLNNANAGTLPGELGISNSGAATYSIPIVVPPGTAGLQPAISLDYNSQGGNSIVGLGWSISSMSRIQRCGQTIAQDGVNGRINFSLSDRLCLDGQRLVLVNLPMTDTNYWSDTAEYRTEHDTFSRIKAQGVTAGGKLNGRSFEVRGKDGRIMSYGATESSVVKAIVQVVNAGFDACDEGIPCKPATKDGPIGWALDTVKDRYGNYISYNYTQGPVSGEHLLADIRYGGKGLAPHASVVFEVDSTRPDAWTRYIDAARNDLRSRVKNISTYWGDDL
ncbi:LCCL domain-containing protein, partial [Duganella sp. HH105]|uniref:LCCL domain-containing protein n=1 Tax=Duganella sp. HH105 TaxID=1781067 RepID=UPI001AEF9CB2